MEIVSTSPVSLTPTAMAVSCAYSQTEPQTNGEAVTACHSQECGACCRDYPHAVRVSVCLSQELNPVNPDGENKIMEFAPFLDITTEQSGGTKEWKHDIGCAILGPSICNKPPTTLCKHFQFVCEKWEYN
jgi:hypothetical protein